MTDQATTTTTAAPDLDKNVEQAQRKVLPRFAAFAFAGIILITLLWTKLTPWVSYPIAVLSEVALHEVAPMWVREVQKKPGEIDVITSVGVPVPNAGGQIADVHAVDVDLVGDMGEEIGPGVDRPIVEHRSHHQGGGGRHRAHLQVFL